MTSAACELMALSARKTATQSVSCLPKKCCSGSRVGCLIAGDPPSQGFGVARPPAVTPRPRITLGRCRRCRRRSGRAEIELYRRRPFRARLGSKEWSRRKAKHACHQIGRETAHCHIVVLHSAIEITAFDRNSILGSFQLRLQTEKTLIGF